MTGFRKPRRSVPVTAHLPPDLAIYVEGMAEIDNQSLSTTVVNIIRRDFDRAQAEVTKRKKPNLKALVAEYSKPKSATIPVVDYICYDCKKMHTKGYCENPRRS